MFLIFIYVSILTVFLAFINLRAFAIQCRQARIFFLSNYFVFYAFLFKNANFFARILFVGLFLLCLVRYVAHVHVRPASVRLSVRPFVSQSCSQCFNASVLSHSVSWADKRVTALPSAIVLQRKSNSFSHAHSEIQIHSFRFSSVVHC